MATPGQEMHRFPNGYGASVIPVRGGRELAVLAFDGDRSIIIDLDETTRDVIPIRDDAQIAALP